MGRAHPRSRGENFELPRAHTAPSGSSPLTRGKPSAANLRAPHSGLIPAHAGKTLVIKKVPSSTRAHPRSRGENAKDATAGIKTAGSSPLTRGKPPTRPPTARRPGLIPAHAGKTRLDSALDGGSQAHPRSRGENGVLPSSVRLWGGLIPAHAGKTGRPIGCTGRQWAHPRSRGENRPAQPVRG